MLMIMVIPELSTRQFVLLPPSTTNCMWEPSMRPAVNYGCTTKSLIHGH